MKKNPGIFGSLNVVAGLFFAVAVGLPPLFAAPPQLDTIWPPGASRGSEVEVELNGKFEPWPCNLHFTEPGIVFTPDPEKAGKGTLKIGDKVPIGPVLARAYNEEGATAPVIFMVDTHPDVHQEATSKRALSDAQVIDPGALPLVINGRLPATHDLGAFRIALEKGETLHAALEAYTLRAPVDPALKIYDARGNRLHLVHNSPRHLDPMLSFTAPETGDYLVSVAGFSHPPAVSVFFRGDKKTQYRLHLARNLKDLPARVLPIDLGTDEMQGEEPAALMPGKAVSGTLAEPGAVHRYRVAVEKGQEFLVRVEAYALGYPTDPVLEITKPDGSSLRAVDDGSDKTPDPDYLWKVTEDGEFGISVTDRFRRGGAEMRYRLEVAPPVPSFTATLDKHAYLLEPGKAVELKVKLARLRDHQGELEFSLVGLPDSVTFTPPETIPEKSGDLVLKLEAAAEAAPFQGPITIRVVDLPDEAVRKPLEVEAVFSFVDDNYRGPYVIDETAEIWLTVLPVKKPEEKEPEEKEKSE